MGSPFKTIELVVEEPGKSAFSPPTGTRSLPETKVLGPTAGTELTSKPLESKYSFDMLIAKLDSEKNLPTWVINSEDYKYMLQIPEVKEVLKFSQKQGDISGKKVEKTEKVSKIDGIPTFLRKLSEEVQRKKINFIGGDNIYYFQKQEEAGCGRHALNNLLRQQRFSKGETKGDPLNEEQLAKLVSQSEISLQQICKALWNVSLKKDEDVSKFCPANEDYLPEVLEAAITIIGLNFQPVLNDGDDSVTFDTLKTYTETEKGADSKDIVGLLIHLPGHWSCLRRIITERGVIYTYLDSLASTKENFNKVPLPTGKNEDIPKEDKGSLYNLRDQSNGNRMTWNKDKKKQQDNWTFVVKSYKTITDFLDDNKVFNPAKSEDYQLYLITKPEQLSSSSPLPVASPTESPTQQEEDQDQEDEDQEAEGEDEDQDQEDEDQEAEGEDEEPEMRQISSEVPANTSPQFRSQSTSDYLGSN